MILFSFIIAAAGAYALSPLCVWVAERIGAIDLPSDERRMHERPTARLGGLSIYLSFTVAALPVAMLGYEALPTVVGGLFIVSIGVIDDVYRISPLPKLLFQCMGALTAVIAEERLSVGMLEGATISVAHIGELALSVVWILLLSNAYNLIDGLNGLCGRCAFFSLLAVFAVSVIIGEGDPIPLLIGGATLGFLPYNMPAARLFLGDTGAMFLGFSVGVTTLGVRGSASQAAASLGLVIILIIALPLGDTCFAVIRRLIKGKSPLSADRGHIHHMLVDGGFSHYEASRLLSRVSFVFGVAGVILAAVLT